MRFIPSSVFYYLAASHVDPKATHTIGKNRKAAIVFKYGVKSWVRRLMKNIIRLQIEIYGLNRMVEYSDIHHRISLVEIPMYKRWRSKEQWIYVLNSLGGC